MSQIKAKTGRELDLNAKHIEGLAKLAKFLGREINGEEIFQRLQQLEDTAHRNAELYCNGVLRECFWTAKKTYFTKKVKEIFGGKLPPGFFVNGDPRGAALKLEDKIEREILAPNGIYLARDWGGYVMLAGE